MSEKGGLSADEKKSRMLEIFHQNRDFFQLKDLEKIAAKEKGITMQSVKEVVQGLVDDHLIDSEKIGTSIFYWSFPSKAKNDNKRKLNQLQAELDESTKKLKKTDDTIATKSKGRGIGDELTEIVSKLELLRDQKESLIKELQIYRDTDPKNIGQLNTKVDDFEKAVNRWAENIYTVKSYIKKTYLMENDVVDISFNIISQDLDYIETFMM